MFTTSFIVFIVMICSVYWPLGPLLGSNIWCALDFFLVYNILSYSWELLQTTEMTWHWAMWLYCSSRSGHGERTFSWKPSVRFASKETSSMRTSSAMWQVSFWMFSTSVSYSVTHFIEILLLLFVGRGGVTVRTGAVAVALWKSGMFQW